MVKIASSLSVMLLLMVSGCKPGDNLQTKSEASKVTAENIIKEKSPASPELDLKSPDSAVKSWWRVFDYKMELEKEDCLRRAGGKSDAYLQVLRKMVNIDFLKSEEKASSINNCVSEKFDREIQEVKVESETRAIVIAKIKNTTPIPPDADRSEFIMEARAKGELFKYLFEKTEADWRLSEVYKYDESNKILKKDVWRRIYERDASSVPAWVWMQ